MKAVTLTILAVLGLIGTLAAQNRSAITINVPFNFESGEQLFPPGEYTVFTGAGPNHVVIRSADAKHTLMQMSQPADKTLPVELGGLTFNKYADRYFLTHVWTGSSVGQAVQKSRAEREQVRERQIVKGASPETVTIAAR